MTILATEKGTEAEPGHRSRGLDNNSRPDQAAQEQDAAGAGVADQEEERMIGSKDDRRRGEHGRSSHHDPGCRGRFGSFFFNLDKCLVHDG